MNERHDSRFLRALRREPVDTTPIWLMRQAGRYLPEYRATREKAGDFLTLAGTPELACEVTLQPIRRYGFDAAILFSDILILPHEMGLGLHFVAGEGPKFERPVRDPAAIRQLPRIDPSEDTAYVMQAVDLIRRELPPGTPLIGFAGSPWTVATYMIEGGSSRDFARAKGLLLEHPDA
ncbi:MAG: uroporphyrinogen decarboxylase family protein, partial [Wenzhouxiangellaceae bacterium]|nr:uroporphyrinogen decarboxylase family protein [Wenzhouxiangellaceae bacterium]